MFLGAIPILPEGFDTLTRMRTIRWRSTRGTFQREPSGWREQPPGRIAPGARHGVHRTQLPQRIGTRRVRSAQGASPPTTGKAGYRFYQLWTGPSFPRVIQVTIQHANPYYDDSYAVNSEETSGPYGDAITWPSLIPYIEQHYRGIGPWARALYGGSTGGWESAGRAG